MGYGTITMIVNPPGGVFQANEGKALSHLHDCNSLNITCPGESVMASMDPIKYERYLTANLITLLIFKK